MKKSSLSILGCLALLIGTLGVTGTTHALSPYEAIYKAEINGLPVTVTSVLEVTEEGYRISTAAQNLLGELHEQERFHLAGKRIMVDEYEHRRALLGNARLEQLVVDHHQGIARYQRGGKARDIPLAPGLLGPLSYQIQLRRDLAAGEAEFAYRVLHRGKVKDYHFQREAAETIALPTGEVEAVRIRRVRDDSDRETIFWMAPELDFQLVKLRQIEAGDRYELLLTALHSPGSPGGLQ